MSGGLWEVTVRVGERPKGRTGRVDNMLLVPVAYPHDTSSQNPRKSVFTWVCVLSYDLNIGWLLLRQHLRSSCLQFLNSP